MTREVQRLLGERNIAFRSGNRTLYSSARANLKRGMREAKSDYRRRIEDHLNNSRQVWQGVWHLTNYRANLGAADGDATLAEELNLFFARFYVEPPETATVQPMVHSSFTLTAEEHEVRRTLRAVNPRKAVRPDGIPGRVLKDCANQLGGVFTMIFNQSFSQSTIPPCLKSSTIIPLPKKPHISSLNDYWPGALTLVVIKCFEKLVWGHITSLLPQRFEPHQFAYRSNRSMGDAVATALHAALSHLEQQGSYVLLLFVDFSSVFDTILPYKLMDKLGDLGLPHSTFMWIYSFLTGRSQRVRVGHHTSTVLSISTGSPQGCVLSPLLNSFLTHDYTPTHHSNTIVKFADDITVVGLISAGDESAYRSVNTSELLKKTQQRLHFLRVLRKSNITQRLLVSFYRCSIESLLTYCICVWYTSCTVAQRKALQRVINTAQKIIGCPLLTLEELHSSRCLKIAQNIIKDTSHPGHHLFELLLSGKLVLLKIF
ncbi:hypothetical protein QTP70_002694 [Hemibagrus guttatus]|uniref:Reverse transcriptase domain-containing protein n=1 Tax=Hemibagrus guttatus TaxID=175788 RepID=A0AAE0PSF8_9TELE|nr:hypothetical protein QTP70_002694 [Hemibagrus guttatus]